MTRPKRPVSYVLRVPGITLAGNSLRSDSDTNTKGELCSRSEWHDISIVYCSFVQGTHGTTIVQYTIYVVFSVLFRPYHVIDLKPRYRRNLGGRTTCCTRCHQYAPAALTYQSKHTPRAQHLQACRPARYNLKANRHCRTGLLRQLCVLSLVVDAVAGSSTGRGGGAYTSA